jgi:4-hydroxy-4-methyl-2-oxoglutarate aldolase
VTTRTVNTASPDAEAIRQRYLKVDAATVSDVLDALGYLNQGLAANFAPYPESAGKLAGWAYTICGEMRPLVDGGIRDIEWIAKQGFPVYARYRTPVQSIGRWKVTAWQVPAYLPGATKQHVIVNPGDFVLGDADGVIVVPADAVEKVLNEAERLTATEVRIRSELDAGATLEQVLAKYGHV